MYLVAHHIAYMRNMQCVKHDIGLPWLRLGCGKKNVVRRVAKLGRMMEQTILCPCKLASQKILPFNVDT